MSADRRAAAAAPRRVLVLKPCCLGDVALATPLLASLRAAWPAASFHWAVDAHSRAAVVGHPDLARLLDASGCLRGDLRPQRLLGLVRALRAGRYDLAVVPDRSPLAAIVPWLARVPQRVGLDAGGRGRWHTLRVPTGPDDRRPEAEIYLDLARALGLATAPPRPVFHPAPADRAAAAAALAPLGHARPRVALHVGGGVNPGMRLPEKRWPPERFGALAARLAARGAATVWLGGPGPEDAAAGAAARAAAAAAIGRAAAADAPAVDLVGRLSIGAGAAAVAECDLYVGSDSGMAHLAVGVGTPVVVIFGPTDPLRYGPPPGAGVAVAPPGEAPVAALAAARGSDAVRRVSLEAVWAAVSAGLARGDAPEAAGGGEG